MPFPHVPSWWPFSSQVSPRILRPHPSGSHAPVPSSPLPHCTLPPILFPSVSLRAPRPERLYRRKACSGPRSPPTPTTAHGQLLVQTPSHAPEDSFVQDHPRTPNPRNIADTTYPALVRPRFSASSHASLPTTPSHHASPCLTERTRGPALTEHSPSLVPGLLPTHSQRTRASPPLSPSYARALRTAE